MEESTRYLLIGGMAAAAAAESIREHDPDGRVVIVGLEQHPPYDRPPLSKQSLVADGFKPDDAYSKQDSFYPDHKIELHTGVAASGLDRAGRTVHLATGDRIRYEKLLLATGATPRPLEVPGNDLKGLYYLRTIEQSAAIRAALHDARSAVVVGSGYMGMEVTSGCAERGLETTVIEPQDHPWAKFASPVLGGFMREAYQARGVRFLFGEEVSGLVAGRDGTRVAAVSTKKGQRVETDLVLACVGVSLNTQLAREAGLEVDPRDGVVVNEFLQTGDPDIWAAGDIACFQDVAMGKRWHAEHFLNAQWQGAAAGANMAGERKPYNQVPYFFSDFLDLHMILRGDPETAQHSVVRGDLPAGEFVELYYDEEEHLRCGVAISHDEAKLDPFSNKLEELIRARARVKYITAASLGL